jgi:hypothetical protein
MNTIAMPDNRKTAAFRKFSIVAGIAAIVGMADALRAVFWMALTAAAGNPMPWTAYLQQGIRLAGWVMIAYCAWLVVRKRTVPPTWAIVALPAVIWAAILSDRFIG